MSFEFPSRFLKKLDIYQQIRSDQGITKYKRLWKYESAFLEVAYREPHQHLNSFSDKNQVIEWIQKSLPDYLREDYEQILGNLFYKGYLEARNKQCPIPSALVTRDNIAVRNREFAQIFEYRVTPEGLLVGEVLSEIRNTNPIIRWWNKYRYELIIDTLWLLLFFGVYKVVFPDQDLYKYINFKILAVHFNAAGGIAFVIFLGWPFLNFLYRKLYLWVEKYKLNGR
ncbi:MAG: hypothetical protein A3E36_00245 [Candidatus Andersenbacteria bacterium RIFCSPHIGHO2_12_FULL_45_11b]|uniref:Uncharacterized protein n=1 Tax=Candidatus Andersenbacteria bacterium RIFCSPHIGHO2_12_FULL_45_11b TaxID=1797282 RepID=A0A1G1X6H4_9BACT|nr:MAG: hypothetical protein A3E36_00245 [Candidatus Andersenbacteria bacterium RIFCSPHIGHO2_12_FULL_45_11b]